MPRIRCLYGDCVFLDEGYCSAGTIKLDPDLGCQTYRSVIDVDEDGEPDYDEETFEDWDQEDLEIDSLLGKDDSLLDDDDF
jgi:Fe-S-cluster containining protein